jgi:O-succinylhomoserine sulfhydrylase
MMHQTDHRDTIAIRAQVERSSQGEHSVPLYLTSSFQFDSGEEMAAAFAGENDQNIYSRYSNPNVDELVKKISLLEGAESGLATATGMAAVFSTLATLVSAGDHIIASRALFGSAIQIISNILPKWNVTYTYVDPIDVSSWEQAVQKNTKLIFLETPSNPSLWLTDLEEVNSFAKKHKLLLIVDNCFATPIIQRPISYGADLVVHSATKYMDGQGRV